MIFPCPQCKQPTEELRMGVVFWCKHCQKEFMITEIYQAMDSKRK